MRQRGSGTMPANRRRPVVAWQLPRLPQLPFESRLPRDDRGGRFEGRLHIAYGLQHVATGNQPHQPSLLHDWHATDAVGDAQIGYLAERIVNVNR